MLDIFQNPKLGCENLLQGSINRDTCSHLFLWKFLLASSSTAEQP